MTRPLDPPVWSTDTNYPAGSETWSGTPTKVAPSSGMRQSGHVPEQAPSAQIENYDRNLIGQWLAEIQDQQVLNWPRRAQITTATSGGNPGICLAYSSRPSIAMLGGVVGNGTTNNAQYSYDGGETWANASVSNANTDAFISSMAASGSNMIAAGQSLGSGTGGQNIYRSTDGGKVWVGNVTLPSSSTGIGFGINHVIRAASVFVALGNDHANVAYCATSPDGASGNWTQRTLPGGTGARTALKAVASGSRIVAFGSNNGAASTLGWYSDDAGATWSNFTAPTNFVIAAAYSAEAVDGAGLWMALGRSGNDATVHISADGINWGSSLGTLANAGAPSIVGNGGNGLAVSGSLWIASAGVPSATFPAWIYYSTNAGVNWRRLFVGNESQAVKAVHFAPHLQNGFHGVFSLAESQDAGGGVWTTVFRQSMRLGLPPLFL
jgi:hypothetical protein